MNTKHTLHVLTNRRGAIIAAGYIDNVGADDTQVQIVPLKGQTLLAVPATKDIGTLELHTDFRRFRTEFHLPRGKQELMRKRIAASRKKAGRAVKKRAVKKRAVKKRAIKKR